MDARIQSIQRQSKYDAWAGKTASASMRFHHLLPAPPALPGGYEVASTGVRDSPEPALDLRWWNLREGKGGAPVRSIWVQEHASLRLAHQALLQSLESISRMDVDYSPGTGGPGEVYILGRMARDNLFVDAPATDTAELPMQEPLLGAVDRWALSDWPLAVSRQKPAAGSLGVTLRAGHGEGVAGEPIEILAVVSLKDAPLNLFDLPHRIAVDPGVIERKGQDYFFTPRAPGKASISVSVLGPNGEHGGAALSLTVRPK